MIFPFQFIRAPEDNFLGIEAGVWVKAAEVVAWLEEHGEAELAANFAEIENAQVV